MPAYTRKAPAPRRAPRRLGAAYVVILLAISVALGLGAASSHAQPQPFVSASIDSDWVSLIGWTPGSTVSLDIGTASSSVTIGGGGGAFIQRQTHGQDIAVGMTIVATDGTTMKTLTVANVRITDVDFAADTVTGTAAAGSTVHVVVNQMGSPPLGQAAPTADAAGTWSVSFAGSVDLRFNVGMGVSADVGDAEGDRTSADRGLQMPTVAAFLDYDGIWLSHWTPGSTVTLHIGGAELSATVNEWGFASIGHEILGEDIVPGMTITATAGTTTKSLTVADVRITSVDVQADTVRGIAPPFAAVSVDVDADVPNIGHADATADAAGQWVASPDCDIQPGNAALANTADEDGDVTGTYMIAGGPPTADSGGPYTLPEGSTIELQGSGTGGEEPFTFEWLGATSQLDDPSRANPRFTGRDDDELTLTLVVTDAAGLTGSDDTTVTVTNQPPLVSPIGVDTESKGRLQIGAAFVDLGRLDTHTASVGWGDGTESAGIVKEKPGIGAVVASHQYAHKGTYTVRLTVRDDDGGQDTVQRQVKVR